jgi:hypothetical protein
MILYLKTGLTNLWRLVGKDKKRFDENLQETRTRHHNKIRYQKRVQEEQEAEQELKEFQKNEDRETER